MKGTHHAKARLWLVVMVVWSMALIGFGESTAIAAPDVATPPPIRRPFVQAVVADTTSNQLVHAVAILANLENEPSSAAGLSTRERRELEKLRLEKQITQLIDDRLSRSADVQDRIEVEVDRAFERTTTILNILLAVLTGIPILIAFFIWILRRSVISQLVNEVRTQVEQEIYGELKAQREIALQAIEDNKSNALTQVQQMVQESTGVLNELKAQIQIADDELDLLKSQATAQIESMVSDAEEVKNQAIQELTTLIPGFPQEAIAPDSQPRIGRLTNLLDSLKSAIPQLNFTASDCVKQGNALFFASRYDDAITAYDRAIQLDPDQYDAWFGRASTLVVQQDYDDALAAYEQAIALNSQAAEAWSGKGNVLRKLQQLDTALTALQQAVELKPEEIRIGLNLASLQLELQEYEAAATTYGNILAQKPDSLKAVIGQVHALRELNRLDDAIATCDRSLNTLGDEADLWYLKAVCQAMQKRVPEAINALATAIRLNDSYQTAALDEPAFDAIRETPAFIDQIQPQSTDDAVE